VKLYLHSITCHFNLHRHNLTGIEDLCIYKACVYTYIVKEGVCVSVASIIVQNIKIGA
jgi:hypothetical protein